MSATLYILERVSRDDPPVKGVSNKVCTREGWQGGPTSAGCQQQGMYW